MAKPEVRRTLTGILQGLAHGIDLWTIWRDFCEIAAITISNRVDLTHYDERETRYLAIVKRYTRPQLDAFARAFGTLVDQLEEGIDDVLGRAFMDLELGNKWAGPFFTPFHLFVWAQRLGSTAATHQFWRSAFLALGVTTGRSKPWRR